MRLFGAFSHSLRSLRASVGAPQGITLTALLHVGTSIQLPEGVVPSTTPAGEAPMQAALERAGRKRMAASTPASIYAARATSGTAGDSENGERAWFAAAAAMAVAESAASKRVYSPSKGPNAASLSPVELAKRCLSRASDPTELVCRDEERARITRFITEHLESESPGSL